MSVAPDTNIEQILDKYDTSGDGKFQRSEVRKIISDLASEKSARKTLRKTVCLLSVALVIAIGSNLAMVVVGTELMKESHTDQTTGVSYTAGTKQTQITGSAKVTATVQSATRRRLHTAHGRQMYTVADLPQAACQYGRTMLETYGILDGVVQILGITDVTRFQQGSVTSHGSNWAYVYAPSHGWYYVYQKSDGSCTVSFDHTGSRRKMQALSHEESLMWNETRQMFHTRNLLETREACQVYHCFAGDEDCDDPSGNEHCLGWDASGTHCEHPRCMLMEEAQMNWARNHLRHRRLCMTDGELDPTHHTCAAMEDHFHGRGLDYHDYCFPSHATVMREDGSAARVDELLMGDRILAADANGQMSFDEVSLFSLARSDVQAQFVRLTTEAGSSLALTPDHHLPVGTACCSQLKQAKDVRKGDKVWLAGSASAAARLSAIVAVELSIDDGLHNPLMAHGSFPVVDGLVTAFNRIEIVTADARLVPAATALCAATGTCTSMRALITAAECMSYHTAHILSRGALAQHSLCKTFHYVDGAVCHAGWCTSSHRQKAQHPSPELSPEAQGITRFVSFSCLASLALIALTKKFKATKGLASTHRAKA